MSLKTRIIPILLWDGKQAVKTVQFQRPARPVGSMMQHIQTMNARNVDELIILDINATLENREPLYEKIKEFTNECYMPVTIGGGISKLEHIEKLLNAGADKIIIGTNLCSHRFLIDATEKFGSQCIVVNLIYTESGHFQCHKQCWHHMVEYINYLEDNKIKIGELILTSKYNDGVKLGYDCFSIKSIANCTSIPIIANSGCGHPDHMLEAIQAGAHAVAASSLFLFSEWTPLDCAEYLKHHGVDTRI